MAVDITGGDTWARDITGDGTNNTAFTIPSDATAVVVFMCGNYTNSVSHDFDELNFRDEAAAVDFTALEVAKSTGSENDVAAYILTKTDANWPGDGAQTLRWSWNSSVNDGGSIIIQAFKGLDTATPKRDSDSNMGQGNPYAYSPSLTGVDGDDLTVILGSNYAATTFTEGGGQTVIEDRLDNNIQFQISYEGGEGSPTVNGNNSGVYGAGLSFALKVAPPTGPPKPVFVNQAINRSATY